MRPRLIACDVDGTLLPAGQADLPHELAALIKRVVNAGIVFVPASGRQLVGLKKLFAPVAGIDSYVAENGVLSCVGDEFVHRDAIERSLGDELVRAILSRPECELYVAGAQTCYTQTDNRVYVDYLRDGLRFDVTVVQDALAIPEPYLKISAYHAACNPDRAFWQGYSDRCNVAVSGPDWVDCVPLGASKAVGVAAVCKKLGIDTADCIAFGDADNDVEMLDLVGRAVAVQSGSPASRAHADEVTPSVAAVLEQILAD